jgi:hypothetical protein
MNYEDKTKETLVRELAELRQWFRLLEEKKSKQNSESKQNDTLNSKILRSPRLQSTFRKIFSIQS